MTGFGVSLDVKQAVDWDALADEEIVCEEPEPDDAHPAEVYLRGKCLHCPREMVRAVCRFYADWVRGVTGMLAATKCRVCGGKTPSEDYYTVIGEVGQ